MPNRRSMFGPMSPYSLLANGILGEPDAATYTDTKATALVSLLYRVGVGD